MKKIAVKHTYDLNLAGKPSQDLEHFAVKGSLFGLNPYRYNLKLRTLIKEGDTVKIGTPLFQNKKDEAVVIVSPVSGTVKTIEYGAKRIVKQVIIESDGKQEAEALTKPLTDAAIKKLSADDVATLLQKFGLWQAFTAHPFQAIPVSESRPPAIYVSLTNDEPYMPEASVILNEYKEAFLAGLSLLKQLSAKVYVAKAAGSDLPSDVSAEVTHEINGHYPANNHGVFLYHNKEQQEENASWGVYAQDVIRFGQLCLSGAYPTERIIVLAGALANKPRHIKIQEGASLEFLKNEVSAKDPLRVVAGGVLTGDKIDQQYFLGAQDFALHLLREGSEQEYFTFFRGGFDKPTHGRTYLSALTSSENTMTTSLNGGVRACISCSVCPSVCPVGLYPQVIMKSLYANDTETAVEYGFLDCVQCGLCTHVCPSKIDMDVMFKDTKDKLFRDVHQ